MRGKQESQRPGIYIRDISINAWKQGARVEVESTECIAKLQEKEKEKVIKSFRTCS